MDRKRRLMENNNGWPLRSQLLDGAPFYAQLTNSLVLNRGTGSPTYTGATTKTFPDNMFVNENDLTRTPETGTTLGDNANNYLRYWTAVTGSGTNYTVTPWFD